MSLTDQINQDIKSAMLAKDKEKLEALRAVKAALLLVSTEKGSSGEVSQEAEGKVLQKLMKQRLDAAQIFEQQGRADLAEVERKQMSYIEPYLPKAMSDEEILSIISTIITSGSYTSADFGKLMGLASKQIAGRADNKRISELIRQKLS